MAAAVVARSTSRPGRAPSAPTFFDKITITLATTTYAAGGISIATPLDAIAAEGKTILGAWANAPQGVVPFVDLTNEKVKLYRGASDGGGAANEDLVEHSAAAITDGVIEVYVLSF